MVMCSEIIYYFSTLCRRHKTEAVKLAKEVADAEKTALDQACAVSIVRHNIIAPQSYNQNPF